MKAAFARTLQRLWWRPRLGVLTAMLTPLAAIVGFVRRRGGATARRADAPLPVPVIVVGNVIVGGAGKTPTVIPLVALLRSWGLHPGIVSRGHGRAGDAPLLLDATTPARRGAGRAFGDEPLLMHRRTGAPVAVARQRRDAALRLLRGASGGRRARRRRRPAAPRVAARHRARGVRRPRRWATAGRCPRGRCASATRGLSPGCPASMATRRRRCPRRAPAPLRASCSSTAAGRRRPRGRCRLPPSACWDARARALGGAVGAGGLVGAASAAHRETRSTRCAAGRCSRPPASATPSASSRCSRPKALTCTSPECRSPTMRASTRCRGTRGRPTSSSPRRTRSSSTSVSSASTRVWVATLGPRVAGRALAARAARGARRMAAAPAPHPR